MSQHTQPATPKSSINSFRSHPLLGIGLLLATSHAFAQAAPPPAEPTPPAGTVISSSPFEVLVVTDARPAVPVTNEERVAVEITSINLDLHLHPAGASEEAHATLVLRNAGKTPLERIPLQISSTLHWLSASAATHDGLKPIAFTQSPINTDADHTGYAQEAIFTPAEPLAAGATMALSVLYSGEIQRSADRLELIGAPHDRAVATDWDAIVPTSDDSATALRGFGNVLWYPCAAPSEVFGNGNHLFELIARERQRNVAVPMHLRLTVEYVGDPPDSAIFNGRIQPLFKAPDVDDQLVDATQGTATADFPLAPIGFRTPNLFLTAQHAVTTEDRLLTVISAKGGAITPYATAVASLQPVLAELLGPAPRQPLLLLDHDGEPFEDAGFVVAQLTSSADPKLVAPALIRGLTHAWYNPQARAIPAAGLWLDGGLPEFMSLVWTERTHGREALTGELRHASVLVALGEPAEDATERQPLTSAWSDTMLRLKSAFVLVQLRALLGDEAFSKAIAAWREALALHPGLDRDETAFETTLETTAKTDLAWFFSDWVYRDAGLPDLTIVQANPRPLPVRAGRSGGYLVAVEVRNDGGAVADVPVTVRAGTLTATERLRILPHASASTRVVFQGTPESVEVNDGSVPEVRANTHTLDFPPPTVP